MPRSTAGLFSRSLANHRLRRGVRTNNPFAVQLALAHGANPNSDIWHLRATGWNWKAPLGMVDDGSVILYALRKGFTEVAQLLADAGASLPRSPRGDRRQESRPTGAQLSPIAIPVPNSHSGASGNAAG